MKWEKKMQTIDRRNAIKAGLIGAASLPLLPVGNAAAQSGRDWHLGHRVVPREESVFGLSSSIVTDERLEDLPDPVNSTRIVRNGDRDYVAHVARLLEMSYRKSQRSRGGVNFKEVTGDDFSDDAGKILKVETEVKKILEHSDSKFYWVDVNPVILVVIVPRAVMTLIGGAIGGGTAVLTFRPFFDGFFDEAGRSVWRWMESLVRESGQ